MSPDTATSPLPTVPDERGRFGDYGGRYVPEVLIPALDELANAWARLRDDPRFRAVVSEIAAGWITRARSLRNPTQHELQIVAHAHYVRGEKAEAIAALRRALAVGGTSDAAVREDLAALGAAPSSAE